MKFAVDRLEGGFAVCIAFGGAEDGCELVFSLPARLFPAPPREGDIYTLTLEPDEAGRVRRFEQVKSKLNRLFDKDKRDKGEETK